MYLQRKEKLYCTFIDHEKAFDSVQRGMLWGKLLNSGVNGKVLRVIRDMYAKTKSCVKLGMVYRSFCLKRWSASGGKFVASFVFAVFE